MTAAPIAVDELLAAASQATGLDDFGAPAYREGLDRLAASLNEEAKLSDQGAAMVQGLLTSILANRLRIESWWSTHPELADERISRPVVIVGMSRSGTTALSQLLANDPALRSLMRWEALASVPPSEPTTWRDDPRFLATVEADRQTDVAIPGMKALHHDPPDGPVECNQLFAHTFQGSMFWTTFHVPSFFEWTNGAELSDAYAYHERMLQLLQSRMPGTWNLKGPQHGVTMEALRRQYPDTRLIVTHRDPTACAVSTASLITFLHRVTSRDPRPDEVGRNASDFIGGCVDGLVADAQTHTGRDAMTQVAYTDLVADPMATTRRLYAELDWELTSEVESAMREHLARHPQNEHGVHRYAAADFALDPRVLDDRYRSYRETFDLKARAVNA